MEAVRDFIPQPPGCRQVTSLAPNAAWRLLPSSKRCGPSGLRTFGSTTRSQSRGEVSSAATRPKRGSDERTRRAVPNRAIALRSRSERSVSDMASGRGPGRRADAVTAVTRPTATLLAVTGVTADGPPRRDRPMTSRDQAAGLHLGGRAGNKKQAGANWLELECRPSGSLSKRKARKRALRVLNQADYYAADKRKF